jgi:hypothetical protein
MVHFIVDDCEDLQQPNNQQCSICVIIVTMHLLYVQMLEIVQLICDVRLGPNRMYP